MEAALRLEEGGQVGAGHRDPGADVGGDRGRAGALGTGRVLQDQAPGPAGPAPHGLEHRDGAERVAPQDRWLGAGRVDGRPQVVGEVVEPEGAVDPCAVAVTR